MTDGAAAVDARAGAAREGTGAATPHLELDGFSGPLEALLLLARANRIDLACISLPALVEQLVAALERRTEAPLGEKADWLVMAAWLALLRTRLLLPPDAREQRTAAEAEAERLRGALLAAAEMQALAAWLTRRPQLGRDVFARGQPELVGLTVAPAHEIDFIEFLWAALDLFDDEVVDTASVYRPPVLDLYSVQDARARILRLLAQAPEGQLLDRLLPEQDAPVGTEGEAPPAPRSALRRRSAWSSTLAACLELAKQGEVTLAQESSGFGPVVVSSAPPRASAPGEAPPDVERDPC
ncbi:MAG: hypothetical protein JO157_09620 [Acetobacteraceae bacterium]|nr:hypothetical protein [Acetobacteraceae bacterium]